jgi:pyruvate dehydrogenase E1 component alpha subunit
VTAPSIVEGVTMRMHGHAEHDPADYVLKELYEEYSKKDPVELFEGVLVDAGVLDVDAAKQVREDARQLAIAARRKSLADPMPDPSNIEDGVYAD